MKKELTPIRREYCVNCNQLLKESDTHCPMCGVEVNKRNVLIIKAASFLFLVLPITVILLIVRKYNVELFSLFSFFYSKALQQLESIRGPTTQMGFQLQLIFLAVFLGILTMAGLLIASRKL